MASARVLLIGIDQANDPNIPALPGAREDVRAWLHVFVRMLGLPSNQYRILLGGPPPTAAEFARPFVLLPGMVQQLIDDGCFGTASRDEIDAGLTWLVDGAEKGEQCVLVYCGHGTWTHSKIGKPHRAICPFDTAVRWTSPLPLDRADSIKGPLSRTEAPSLQRSTSLAARALTVPEATGLLLLPERSPDGSVRAGGTALDRAAIERTAAWNNLTIVLDCSFESSPNGNAGTLRSLPVRTPGSTCFPTLDISSRTICAARPGHHAHEYDNAGAFSSIASQLLLTWPYSVATQPFPIPRLSHFGWIQRCSTHIQQRGIVQQPTLAGHASVGISQVFCPDWGCEYRDEAQFPLSGNIGQIHAGNTGVRVMEIRFATINGGTTSYTTLGWVASVAVSVNDAFSATQSNTVNTQQAKNLWANGASPYPRAYAADTEYWRTIDTAVIALFEALAEGRLVGIGFRLHWEHAWTDQAAMRADWYHQVFEQGTRKRHCSVYPSWPPTAVTGISNAHNVHGQAMVGTGWMDIQFQRDPLRPAVITAIRWHHARLAQLGSPTYFGDLEAGGPEVLFTLTGGQQPPPAGRSAWFTADCWLQKEPLDP